MANKKINANNNLTGSIKISNKKENRTKKGKLGSILLTCFLIVLVIRLYYYFSEQYVNSFSDDTLEVMDVFLSLVNSSITPLLISGIIFLAWKSFK